MRQLVWDIILAAGALALVAFSIYALIVVLFAYGPQ